MLTDYYEGNERKYIRNKGPNVIIAAIEPYLPRGQNYFILHTFNSMTFDIIVHFLIGYGNYSDRFSTNLTHDKVILIFICPR